MVSKRDFLSTDVKSTFSLAFLSHGTRVHKDHKTTVTLHGGSAFSWLSSPPARLFFSLVCALSPSFNVCGLSLSPLLSASLARERVVFSLYFPDHCPATLTNFLPPYLLSYPPPLPLFLHQLPFSLASPFPRKTERRDKRREKRGEKSEYKREESVTQQIQRGELRQPPHQPTTSQDNTCSHIHQPIHILYAVFLNNCSNLEVCFAIVSC